MKSLKGIVRKRNLFFPKRIPEPKTMDKLEFAAFQNASLENYKRWMIPFVDDALEKSGWENGVIVDVACGPGLLTKEIAQRSLRSKLFGVDVSNHAISLARRNCKGLLNATFRVANAHHLPFRSGSVDLVVCKDSLHHFKNARQALHEMIRILRFGGLIYLQDLRRDLPPYFLQRCIPLDSVFKKLQFYSARAAYTKEELKRILLELSINHFEIKTRKVTDTIRRRYESQGIDKKKLKEAFQCRYVAVIKKSKNF